MEQITTGTAAESAAQSAKLAQAANDFILAELRTLRQEMVALKEKVSEGARHE